MEFHFNDAFTSDIIQTHIRDAEREDEEVANELPEARSSHHIPACEMKSAYVKLCP